MKFEYFEGEQKSPEWFEIRLGKVTASRLTDWLATSKRDGKPLKARKDYEKELVFERTFNTSFERFITSAMQDGIDYECFARDQYSLIKGVDAQEAGCWHNDHFVASPDGLVGDDGLLEVKWLRDSNFTEVLESGVLEPHWKQIQGQLFASRRKWCDYVAGNLNTKKLKIIRVKPDKEFFKELNKSLKEEVVAEAFDMKDVYDFAEALPSGADKPQINEEVTSNLNELGF